LLGKKNGKCYLAQGKVDFQICREILCLNIIESDMFPLTERC
jgi:hypothetical protein